MKTLVILCFTLYTLFANDIIPKGWPWTGIDIKAFSVNIDNEAISFIIENDIRYVRIHINIRKTMIENKVNAKEAMDLNFHWSEELVSQFDKYEIKSFITIADFPISLNECSNKRNPKYWQNQECIDRIYADVNQTVNRFKDTSVLGYEFLGEPVVIIDSKAIVPAKWEKIFEHIIQITRSYDKDKWLFYSPGPWGLPVNYDRVHPLEDDKIIYNAHMYLPHKFTHQYVGKEKKIIYKYPGYVGIRLWDKVKLEKTMKKLLDFQVKYEKPVCISEFSAALWAPGSEEYLSDLIETFNKYNWGWMYFNIGGDYKGFDARYDAYLDIKGNKIYQYKGNASKRFKVLSPYLLRSNKMRDKKTEFLHKKDKHETSNSRK